MKNEKKTLAINTLMLYVLTFSNYFFAFITVPYQTRVFGPEIYGILGFALAAMMYFQLVLDFGFTLSGTAEIAKNRTDKIKLANITESITAGKFLLAFPCALAMLLICKFIPYFAEHSRIFWIFWLYTLTNALIPDFLYRGMENMKPITYRTISVRAVFTVCIFFFVKSPQDYVLVPVFYFVGSLIAVVIAYTDAFFRFRLSLTDITFKDVWIRISASFPFFISRIASTAYGATNMLLLGCKFPDEAILGYYASADKIAALARYGASPIADSLYPYLISHRDFKVVRKLFVYLMPPILLGAVILFVVAPQICTFLFGEKYAEAALPLRALLPCMVIVLPNYILGFPIMTPLGAAGHANLSVILGAVVQIIQLAFIWGLGYFSLLSVCIVTSLTETFVFLYRLAVVVHAFKKLESPI